MRMTLAALGFAAVCGTAAAQTAPNQDGELCRNISKNPDLTIKHCTAAIIARSGNSETQALWHVQRGIGWADKRDYDRAIADHTAALQLDARARNAHYFRGAAYSHKGDFERAIADFDRAIQLRPEEPVIYHARGIEHMIKGDYARALADFDKTQQLDANAAGVNFARGRAHFYAGDFARASAAFEVAFRELRSSYTALWLYLARRRGGNEDAADLLERDTRGLRDGWPSALIALYLDRTAVSSVNIAADNSEPAQRRETRCEADFYVAQWHLTKGERARAQSLLQDMQRSCPKNLLEYEGATAELRRLQ